jgi:hypothetical protein
VAVMAAALPYFWRLCINPLIELLCCVKKEVRYHVARLRVPTARGMSMH